MAMTALRCGMASDESVLAPHPVVFKIEDPNLKRAVNNPTSSSI